MGAALGMVAAFLPRRYWRRIELASRVTPRPALSAIASVVAGLCAGAPAFIRHVARGSEHATSLTMQIAGHQLRHAAEHEVTSAFTQTLTMVSIVTFVATPVGFLCVYLVLSGALRAAAVYFDDPMGDPLLTAADGLVRAVTAGVARARRRIAQQVRFGRRVPDRVTDGAAVGNPDVDVAVLSSRPKDGWTIGTMVLARGACYRIVAIDERRVDGRLWVAYLLSRKTDSEIVRRAVRYAW